MTRLFAFALLLASLVDASAAAFPSIRVTGNATVAGTNFNHEVVVTNGLTLGGVRNTAWPAGGIAGTLVTNAVLTTGDIYAVGADPTNAVKATSANLTNALGAVYVLKSGDTMSGALDVTGIITGRKSFQSWQGTLTHAGTTSLDFDGATTVNSLSATGNLALATANLATNRTYRLKITAPATNCLFTTPAWIFMTGTVTNLTATKTSMLTLEAWGSTDGSVLAWFQEAP